MRLEECGVLWLWFIRPVLLELLSSVFGETVNKSTKQLRMPKFARPAITERRRRLIRGNNEGNEIKTETFALVCGKSVSPYRNCTSQ